MWRDRREGKAVGVTSWELSIATLVLVLLPAHGPNKEQPGLFFIDTEADSCQYLKTTCNGQFILASPLNQIFVLYYKATLMGDPAQSRQSVTSHLQSQA